MSRSGVVGQVSAGRPPVAVERREGYPILPRSEAERLSCELGDNVWRLIPPPPMPGRRAALALTKRLRNRIAFKRARLAAGGREMFTDALGVAASMPHRGVKTTLGGDSHFGLPTIHTCLPAYPQAR